MSDRRHDLAEAATDYVLEHGLLDLSLRPLAAALGTSDRMLLYHFGSKDELVAAVLRTSNEWSTAHVRAMEPSADLRAAVHDLWATMLIPQVDRCSRLYVEWAALGLLGTEPYASAAREANELWIAALVDHLVRSGVRRPLARRAVRVIDAAFMGFQLDLPLDVDLRERKRNIGDLADAVASIAN
jgi:AcrR family transcriptional regulator